MLYKRLILNGQEFILAVGKSGAGAPTSTTEGSPGLSYLDEETGKMYKCTAATDGVYTWEPSESGGGGGAFFAAYGLTTNEEIWAAYKTGLAVFAHDPATQYVLPAFSVTEGQAHFSGFDGDKLIAWKCSDDAWTTSNVYPANVVEVASFALVKSGDTVTITSALEGGGSIVDKFTFDANGYPISINANGKNIPITVEGFDA